MEPIINSVDACIKWPFKWTLVGSSGSGKTNFAINMIKESGRLFDQKADRVIIIYKKENIGHILLSIFGKM